MMIIQQIKTYIYGDIFNIDKYANGSYGWADCVFAESVDVLKEKLRGLVENGTI